MRYFKKSLIILVLLIQFVPIISGCYSGPEATVKKFEKSYNKLDFKGIIECMDPVTAKAANAIISLTGDLLGIDSSKLVDAIPIIPKLFKEGNKDSMPKINIKIIDSKIEGDSAVVYTEVTVLESGKKEVYNAEFLMIKVDGNWYIEDVQ